MHADIEKRKAYHRQWREKNRHKTREYAKRTRIKNPDWYAAKANYSHRKVMRTWRRKLSAALGGKCCKCGFDDERAFQFHHKKKNGRAQRDAIGSSYKYYKEMLESVERGEDDIELLCANCHAIEHWIPDQDAPPSKPPGQKSKMTDNPRLVSELRGRYANGESMKQLSKLYGVSQELVSRLVKPGMK